MNIELKIKEIISILRSGSPISPDQLTEYHRILAGEYAFISGHFIQFEILKSKKTKEYRDQDGIKSDAQAERMFMSSEDGFAWITAKRKLKAIEKMLSSLKISAEIEKQNYNNEYRS